MTAVEAIISADAAAAEKAAFARAAAAISAFRDMIASCSFGHRIIEIAMAAGHDAAMLMKRWS